MGSFRIEVSPEGKCRRDVQGGLSPKSTAGTHTIFAVLQATQRQMGQEVDTLCEEIGLCLVAAWLLKSVLLFLRGICLEGQ